MLAGLRPRLVLLVVLALVPALALVLYTASEQRRQAQEDVREETLRLARVVAADQGRLIEGGRQLLIALAELPEVTGGDPGPCNALLADLLDRYPLYANLGVADPEGDVVCSGLPLPGPVSIADRAYFREAVERRDFAVGEYQIGRITERASVNLGYPVLDASGLLHGVVFAALDLAWLNELAALPAAPSVVPVRPSASSSSQSAARSVAPTSLLAEPSVCASSCRASASPRSMAWRRAASLRGSSPT